MNRTALWMTVLVSLLMWSGSGAAQSLERNLAYGGDPGQRLDLWVPAGQGFATVLFVRRGAGEADTGPELVQPARNEMGNVSPAKAVT